MLISLFLTSEEMFFHISTPRYCSLFLLELETAFDRKKILLLVGLFLPLHQFIGMDTITANSLEVRTGSS